MATAEQTVSAVLGATNKRYLVEHKEAEDGSWWYDLYSDGYTVQGGHLPLKVTTYTATWNVNLPKAISKIIAYGATPLQCVVTGSFALLAYSETTATWKVSNAHEDSQANNKQGHWWIAAMIKGE